MLVVGIRLDEVREFKLKPARQTLYLPALVDGVRTINCYETGEDPEGVHVVDE